MPADDPLTPAEQAFRDLLQKPAEFARWAADVRAQWEATAAGKAAVARCHVKIGGFRMKPRKDAA
jgi:hypothetical protein